MKMPIIRSILKLGHSKAVTIPKSWITSAEDQTGRKIVALAMEVNGTITLQPIFEKETKLHAIESTAPEQL
jgi:antitoxin component of MazEF toxin-antitoxin module